MDFMSDALFNGRRFRTLNVIDDFNPNLGVPAQNAYIERLQPDLLGRSAGLLPVLFLTGGACHYRRLVAQ